MPDEPEDSDARWESFRIELRDIMVTAEISDMSLISAGLRAMLDTLELSMSRREAKAFIAKSLNAFEE